MGGYNATVLAYGQTGSGKTHTMGSATLIAAVTDDDSVGIIPRALGRMFEQAKVSASLSAAATVCLGGRALQPRAFRGRFPGRCAAFPTFQRQESRAPQAAGC